MTDTDQAIPSDVETAADDAATLTAPARRPKIGHRKPKQLPPFKILLHNDDKNTFDHVILSILRLTPLAQEEAIVRTLEAHEAGVALLLVTHKERAELYVEQFASVGINLTIEPDAA